MGSAGSTASPLHLGHALCLKRREPAATPGSLQECSSIGRAPVSKTGGRRFEPCHSCHSSPCQPCKRLILTGPPLSAHGLGLRFRHTLTFCPSRSRYPPPSA